MTVPTVIPSPCFDTNVFPENLGLCGPEFRVETVKNIRNPFIEGGEIRSQRSGRCPFVMVDEESLQYFTFTLQFN